MQGLILFDGRICLGLLGKLSGLISRFYTSMFSRVLVSLGGSLVTGESSVGPNVVNKQNRTEEFDPGSD
jgi:hypothetical protein